MTADMADRTVIRDTQGQILALDRVPRRFVLDRAQDVSGVSGTGVVAEGCEFSDGSAVLRWSVGLQSTAVYNSVEELIAIHGHRGSTRLRWVD